MTATSHAVLPDELAPPKPGAARRVAIAATGFFAAALPLMWGASTALELLGGQEPDHRFHQLTGQGLLLSALWLYGVLGMAVAGWRGRRPSGSVAMGHLAFMAGTVLSALTVPGEGVVFLGGLTAATGALLWLAVPVRPALRGAVSGLDPVLAPVAVLGAALFTPFVLAQRTAQATLHDEHAEMTHYFDMAWVCVVVVLIGLVAAVVPAARRLALIAGLGTLVIGVSRLAFTANVTWSLLAILLGSVGVVAASLRGSRP